MGALHPYTIYGFVPVDRLSRVERSTVVGRPDGAWIRLARLSAHSKAEAVAKARRQAWCRDERAVRFRAEVADAPQAGLFDDPGDGKEQWNSKR